MLSPKHLLTDARILVAHASAEGLTIDPAKTDVLLDADRKIRGGQFGIEDEQKLNAVISELVRLVKPASLSELRLLFRSRARFFRFFRISTVLPIISVVLVFLVTGLTTNFSQITSRIAELKTLEQAHYWDKLEHAQRLYTAYQEADKDKNGHETAYTSFEDEMSKLRDVASGLGLATADIRPVINSVTGGPNWCFLMFHLYGFGDWCGSVLLIATPSRTEAAQPAASSTADPKRLTVPQSVSEAQAGTPETSPSTADTANPSPGVQLGNTALGNDIQFANLFGLNITSPDQMQGAYLSRRQAESVAVFLGSSILPLLYGLLGASVFLMRELFGESHGAVFKVTTAKAVLRLGLGGIAGLAIGWFWVPDASKSVSEIAKLSTAPFALAFLAGFSIELLFSLLDRIIAALNPAQPPPK